MTTSLPLGFYLINQYRKRRAANRGGFFIFALPLWIWFTLLVFTIYIWVIVAGLVGSIWPYILKKYLHEIQGQKQFLDLIAVDGDIKEAEQQIISQHQHRLHLEHEALKGLASRAH